MEVEFRLFPASEQPPAAGEIHVVPRRADQEHWSMLRPTMALLVLERGLDALPRGTGDVARVVIPADPTLDDMLAARFAMRLLEGRALPGGLKAFADYAATAREGYRPGQVPLDVSPEGIFQAIRNDADDFTRSLDLTDPPAARRFLAAWDRMAARIEQAAEAGIDPTRTAIFADGPEFLHERAILAKDHDRYRHDVLRGERWRVQLPDCPTPAAGLLLRQPRSLLFKYWSRQDPEAPGGQGYQFLATCVQEGGRSAPVVTWILSTDPNHSVSIKVLAEHLQAAEAAIDASGAAGDPWYDGRRHRHTLVASPRGGTKLAEAEVLRIIKKLARARDFRVGRKPSQLVAVTSALVAIPLLSWAGYSAFAPKRNSQATSPNPAPVVRGEGQRGLDSLDPPPPPVTAPTGSRQGKDYALLFATDQYDHWGELSNPVNDAKTIASELRSIYGFQTELVTDATLSQILERLRHYVSSACADGTPYAPDDQLLIFFAGHGAFDRTTKEGFIVAKDSRKEAEDPDHQSYLQHSRLRDRVENLQCAHIYLVMDVCFGGTFDRFIAQSSRGEDEPGTSRTEFIRRKLAYRTRYYLTSGGRQYVPDGAPGHHSPFARRFLEALRTRGGKDGILTLNELHSSVEWTKIEPRAGEFGTNEPGSDFLFITPAPAAAP